MAGTALDMSLDDLIKNNKKSGIAENRGRGGRSAFGLGPTRRFNNCGANRAVPYGDTMVPVAAWKHAVLGASNQALGDGGPVARASAVETGTKLYISNLDYGVSNDDIKELFAEVGDLKMYSVHYDRSGRSKGTAEVVFSRRQDALSAIKRYNNVLLDGKPMQIEIVRANILTPAGGSPSLSNSIVNMNGFPRSGQWRNGKLGRPRGRGGSAGG